jgi:hypothetical protein
MEKVESICDDILKKIEPIAFKANESEHSPFVCKIASSKILLDSGEDVAMKQACLYGMAAENSWTIKAKEYRQQEMAWYAVAIRHGELGAFVILGQLFEQQNNEKYSEIIWNAAADLGCYEAKMFLGLVEDCC